MFAERWPSVGQTSWQVNREPLTLYPRHSLPTVATPPLRFGRSGACCTLSLSRYAHLHPNTLQCRGNRGLASRASHPGNTGAGVGAEWCVLDVSAEAYQILLTNDTAEMVRTFRICL